MKIPKTKHKKATIPQVFIIESLEFDDERSNCFEGVRIKEMLELSGKECRYVYIRTRAEFEEILEQFWESQYRYLHLSCHANQRGMATTMDFISFEDLADILEPYLENRRLFLSACEMGSRKFASRLLKKSDCYSMLGPSEKVDMADTTMFWSAFYHKMFRLNSEKMIRKHIVETAKSQSKFFSIPLSYLYVSDDTLKEIPIP